MPFWPTRREFLEAGAMTLLASAAWPALSGCGDSSSDDTGPVVNTVDPRDSVFGYWAVEDGVPVFLYDADHPALDAAEWDPVIPRRTRRHWHRFGNRAIQVQADNEGTVALFDEGDGLRIDLGWDIWRRMTFGAHTTAYPRIWEGTLSVKSKFRPRTAARAAAAN